MKTKSWLVGCLVLLVLVLIGGGVALWFLVPEVDDQLPTAMGQTFVTLTTPLNGAGIPLNGITTIEAQAIGAQPIRTLELWIDGVPAQSKTAPAGASLNQFFASWSWMPTIEGEHTLLVRAIANDQQTTTSNVVRVVASKNANVQIVVPHPVKPGETLPGIAGQYKTTPQEIVDVNPGMAGNAVTPGTNLNVPTEPTPPNVSGDSGVITDPPAPNDPVTPEEEAEAPSQKFPGKHGIWIGNIWGNLFKSTPPIAPKIKAKAISGKCAVDIFIGDKSNNETGFMVYRLDSHAHAFQRIATLDANGDASLRFVDDKVYGKLQYYVVAFNAAGKAESNLVKAAITDDQCQTPDWQIIELEKTTVTVTQPVDKMYCYLSVNNGPWTRVPPGEDNFLPVKNGQVDLGKFIKKLAPPDAQGNVTVRLECWAWRGGSLVFLGEASTTINIGQANKPIQFGNPNYRIGANVGRGQIDLSGHTTQPSDGDPPPPPSPWIDPPYGAKFTTDLDACAKHSGSVANCELFEKVNQGAGAFLVWDWKSLICISGQNSDACKGHLTAIDGYNVYRTFPGSPTPTLIATNHYANLTMVFVPTYLLETPTGAFTAPQFFVRAFKGNVESDDSKYVIAITVEPEPTVQDVILKAGATVWDIKQSKVSTWGCMTTGGTGVPTHPAGQIEVGFDRRYHDCTLGHESYSDFTRGAMWFDVSSIKGEIIFATLRLPWKGGRYDPTGDTATNEHVSCAGALLLGLEDFRKKDYSHPDAMPGGKLFRSLNITNDLFEDALLIEVTDAVRGWQSDPSRNFGFTLMGTDESLPENKVDCYTIYGDMSLKVKVKQ